MATTDQHAPATKADLDASFEDMRGYVDTAVDNPYRRNGSPV